MLVHLNSIFVWEWPTSISKKIIIKGIEDTKKTYYGNINEIKKIKTFNIEGFYNYLFVTNCLYSKYPKKLETEKIHERIGYILKHNNIKFNFKNKTNKQIYLEACNSLDKKFYK